MSGKAQLSDSRRLFGFRRLPAFGPQVAAAAPVTATFGKFADRKRSGDCRALKVRAEVSLKRLAKLVSGFLQRPWETLRFPEPGALGSKLTRSREGAKGWTKRLECGLGPAHQSRFASPETLMTLLLPSAKLRISPGKMRLAHCSMDRCVLPAVPLHPGDRPIPPCTLKGRLS